MTTLRELILDPSIKIDRIGAHLDGLDHDARMREKAGLSRKEQRILFQKAGEAEPLDVDYFVPADPLQEVVHQGRNSLPLPAAFRFFQKVMCRPDDGTERAFGFNEGASRPLIGPGYFVLRATAGNPTWESRGSVVVDYFQVPDKPVTRGWPEVVPNSHGLQAIVYQGTRDYMRRVSKHVSVGAAYKGEKGLDHYFVLVRQEHGTHGR